MKNYKQILEAINRGIKFALDDYEEQDGIQGQINSKVNHQHGTKEWLDLMEEVVDLSLPSRTLWCKYNLGVNLNQLSKVEDWYGGYYAWGELEENKPVYYWYNYKYRKNNQLTKYCNNIKGGFNGFTDNLSELLHEDDAAYQNKHLYNFKFHIPTKDQFKELLNYTETYWVNNYNPNKIIHNPEDDKGIQGLNGYIFVGKNGNQLFIPAAGYRNDSNIDNIGSVCELWSSSLDLDNPYYAYHLYFNSDGIYIYNYNRYIGFSIRPVINL